MIDPQSLNDMLTQLWPDLELRCVSIGPTEATARHTPSVADLRPGGFISGPTQFAVADSALWFLVSGALGRLEPMALTSELSIRYLRPAKGDTLTAQATLDKLGKTSVVGTVRVWTNDPSRPCAVAQGTYALPRS